MFGFMLVFGLLNIIVGSGLGFGVFSSVGFNIVFKLVENGKRRL